MVATQQSQQTLLPIPPISGPSIPWASSKHAARLYVHGLGEGSRDTMLRALRQIVHMVPPTDTSGNTLYDVASFPWAALRQEHTQPLREHLRDRYAVANVRKHLAALRGVLRQAWRLHLMDTDAYQRASDLDPIRGQSAERGRAISNEEVNRLLHHCQSVGGASGIRDAAILALLYSTGLRRAELAALELRDWDEKANTVRVRRGKGNKPRTVPCAADTPAFLASWLQTRGHLSGPLFGNLRALPDLVPMRPGAVYRVLIRRAEQAGVLDVSPHDLRRTFIGELLDDGMDLVSVSKAVGHSSVAVTARYDRRSQAKAAAQMHARRIRT